MVLQAYMDESEDASGTFVLAGYISTAEQWAEFSKRWEAALPQALPFKHGGFHFKMAQMARTTASMERVATFHRIIQEHVLMGVDYTLSAHAVERVLQRLRIDDLTQRDLPFKFAHATTPYYFAFRTFMELFHKYRAMRAHEFTLPDQPIDFFFDDRSDKMSILHGWEDYISVTSVAHLYGVTPRFESDNEFLPLQAADFRAWWVRRWTTGALKKGEYYGFVPCDKKVRHLSISVDEEQLFALFRNWVQSELGKGRYTVADRDAEREEESGPALADADAPFPLQRLADWLGRRWRAVFKRD